MSKPQRQTVYDIDGFFRVEHQPVPHKDKPYEFVRRIGAVTMLPIILNKESGPQALVIKNERYHYGTSVNLPAGNIDGGIDTPESPQDAATRELREETGYGYAEGTEPAVSLFKLREVSNSIDYPRFFAVMHDVQYIGGEEHSDTERITRQPIPLQSYVSPLFNLQRGETYPEVNAAFTKAGLEVGRRVVTRWLIEPTPEIAAPIIEAFEPWLIYQNGVDAQQ